MTTPAENLASLKPAKREVSKLRELRIAMNLTLKDVGSACGMSYAGLGYVERGRNPPHLEKAQLLARFFGVTVDELWPPPV